MSVVVDSIPSIGSYTSRYPYEKWFDGQIHCLDHEDFPDISVEAMRTNVRNAARSRNVNLEVCAVRWNYIYLSSTRYQQTYREYRIHGSNRSKSCESVSGVRKSSGRVRGARTAVCTRIALCAGAGAAARARGSAAATPEPPTRPRTRNERYRMSSLS